MSGARFDYDFGKKRNWRRWAWNRIAERRRSMRFADGTTVLPRDALCVYLAGVDDFDRPVAIASGFRHENLIAVERDVDSLSVLRAAGVLAINGDIFAATVAIAKRRRVDVVFADLCGGLNTNVIESIYRLIVLPNTLGCIFAVNMQRGREQDGKEWRQMVSVSTVGLHRGRQLLRLLVSEIVACAMWPEEDRLGTRLTPDEARRGTALESSVWAATFTYRSENGNYFDSIVFGNPFAFADVKPSGEILALLAESDRNLLFRPEQAARSAAAVMAHRTMRLK